MASRDFHQVPKDVRAWLGGLVGSGDSYPAFVRRQKLRQFASVATVIAGLIAIGLGGYAIGASQVGDAGSAQQEGADAGEERGAAVGAREGYESAFRSARKRAFEQAYDQAYAAAYREAFESSDLAAPRQVKVSGP